MRRVREELWRENGYKDCGAVEKKAQAVVENLESWRKTA